MSVDEIQVRVCLGISSVVKIYIIRPKPGPVEKNAWLRIEPASSGLLDQCSTTELQKPLPTTWARVQYIYINEMVMRHSNYLDIT